MKRVCELIGQDLCRQQREYQEKLVESESEAKVAVYERKSVEAERKEISRQVEALKAENQRLLREMSQLKTKESQSFEMTKNVEELQLEKKLLNDRVNLMSDSMKELDSSFKETRWALTAEVAEKHDQIQELRRCVGALEEQLRQADMQTHFKDDIIKEMRKELKTSRKAVSLFVFFYKSGLRSRSVSVLLLAV